MNGRWRVLIAEDHTLFRSGLKALLAEDGELEVVGEADNGRDASRLVGTLKPDLVLMDISMPGMNGIEAIAEIRRRAPEIRIIILTLHKADEYIHAALRAGINGYLLKDATHDELLAAVRTVLEGKTYLSPEISGKVVSSYLSALNSPLVQRPVDALTQRERQVIKLVAEGRTNKYIADFLSLSTKTVEKHRSNLMKKLNIHSIAALTAFAIENGLVGDAGA